MAAIPNVFTEKSVGIAFAAAFALWAWMLNNLASTVMDGVRDIRADQIMIKNQIVELRRDVSEHRVTEAGELSTIRAQQADMLRRLDVLEGYKDGQKSR